MRLATIHFCSPPQSVTNVGMRSLYFYCVAVSVLTLCRLVIAQSASNPSADSASFDADGTAHVVRVVPMPATISLRRRSGWFTRQKKSQPQTWLKGASPPMPGANGDPARRAGFIRSTFRKRASQVFAPISSHAACHAGRQSRTSADQPARRRLCVRLRDRSSRVFHREPGKN